MFYVKVFVCFKQHKVHIAGLTSAIKTVQLHQKHKEMLMFIRQQTFAAVLRVAARQGSAAARNTHSRPSGASTPLKMGAVFSGNNTTSSGASFKRQSNGIQMRQILETIQMALYAFVTNFHYSILHGGATTAASAGSHIRGSSRTATAPEQNAGRCSRAARAAGHRHHSDQHQCAT